MMKQQELGRKVTEDHQQIRFNSGESIHSYLRNNETAPSRDGLKHVRNALFIKSSEGKLDSRDSRFSLAKEWLEISHGANDLFTVLKAVSEPKPVSICMSILTCLLDLTSQYPLYYNLGRPVVHTILSDFWSKKIRAFVCGGHRELCTSALKLLLSASNFAEGSEQRRLLEALPWDPKTLRRLLHSRRKAGSCSSSALADPDIRTLCVQLLLSFVSYTSSIKTDFLEQHKDSLLLLLKGLSADPPVVVQTTLDVLWNKLWKDQKVKRSLKIGIFGEETMQHLVNLYSRLIPEPDSEDIVPANVVHHFLLAVCTHPGSGICFADSGWYPRHDGETSHGSESSGRVYNKILANVLKMLKVNDDSRQQELALRILDSCPELSASYLKSIGLALEPRISNKWLTSVAFLGAAVSTRVPNECFYIRKSDMNSSMTSEERLYKPTPPPFLTIIDNIVPTTNMKTVFSKALLLPNILMQHVSALCLVRCLQKYESICERFRLIGDALGENGNEGQWIRRSAEVRNELRRRIPEFQVIIAFANSCKSESNSPTKLVMLSEISQRLVLLYQRVVPSLYAEARYDIGKSLQIIEEPKDSATVSSHFQGLYVLQEIHVLRMIKEGNQFIWPPRAGTSNSLDLLKLYYKANQDIVREEIKTILTQTLRDTLLFQHDPEEFSLWLESIPRTLRSQESESPDGTHLLDEGDCVVLFLDSCMQRFSKTPHRYIEEFEKLVDSSKCLPEDVCQISCLQNLDVSPVIVTLLEQLGARMRGKLIVPSETLALITFTRKLVVSLLGKQTSIKSCKILTEGLIAVFNRDIKMLESHPDILIALKRECEILEACIVKFTPHMNTDTVPSVIKDSEAVEDFINQLENLSYDNEHAKTLGAYELVDWIRLVGEPVSVNNLFRIATVILHLHAPALSCFLQHIPPDCEGVFTLLGEKCLKWVSFDWLVLNFTNGQLQIGNYKRVLRETLLQSHHNLYSYKRFAGIALLRLGQTNLGTEGIIDILSLLTEKARDDLCAFDFKYLKGFLFEERLELTYLCQANDLSDSLLSSLNQLLETLTSDFEEASYYPFKHICDHWLGQIHRALRSNSIANIPGYYIWIRYMPLEDLANLTDETLKLLISDSEHNSKGKQDTMEIFVNLLHALIGYNKQIAAWSMKNLNDLLRLRTLLPSVTALDKIIALSIEENTPLGYNSQLSYSLEESTALHYLVTKARSKWKSKQNPSPCTIEAYALLLDHTTWNVDTSRAISSLVYYSKDFRATLWTKLQNELVDMDIGLIAPVIHALLDIEAFQPTCNSRNTSFALLFDTFSVYLYDKRVSIDNQKMIITVLAEIFSHDLDRRSVNLETLIEQVRRLPPKELRYDYLELALLLQESCHENISHFMQTVVNYALQWAAHHLSDADESTTIDKRAIWYIICLLKTESTIAPSFAEPVISMVIKKYFIHPHALNLAELLFQKASLKPMNAYRHLQSLLQNPNFAPFMHSCSNSDVKREMAKLIHTICCSSAQDILQPIHLQPLILAYSGSLSTWDQTLLEIFRLFEARKQLPLPSLLDHWSPNNIVQNSFLDVILSLDASRMMATCINFPANRGLGRDNDNSLVSSEEEVRYDPTFILLLLARTLSECPPESMFSWISLFRTNVFSLVIRCLSSFDSNIRLLAITQLGVLYKLLQVADIQEKKHLIYLLDVLRDQIPNDATLPVRLSSYITIFLCHALRGIFYPATFTYPKTARFLLQRYQIDTQDVPLLFSSLYSDNDQWKKELIWMIRFLTEGMISGEDWRLLKRRHTWDLVASLFSNFCNERALRAGILEFLTNLTCHPKAVTSLILKSSLLHWIEMQLQTIKTEEVSAWAKIIENILVVMDQELLRKATGGLGQITILRCLSRLVANADMDILQLLSCSMSRLTSENIRHSRFASQILETILLRLEVVERGISPTSNDAFDSPSIQVAVPPFRNHIPYMVRHKEESLQSWGRTIESLWGFATKFELKGRVWDELSCRLLIWRMLQGKSSSRLGEWVRRQIIQNVDNTLHARI